jgi:hypothetical protein
MAEDAPVWKKKTGKGKGNAPQFDPRAERERISGVDLTTIDGIDVMTAQSILAELGTDMREWKTEAHFVSWMGLPPNREITGGKSSASTLIRSESYLGAKYRSLRARLGAPKAVKAMARHPACLVYRMLTYGQAWVGRGTQAFERKNAERQLAMLQGKAAGLGRKLVAA